MRPRAALLDALGTLLWLEPPAPALRRELAARLGVDVGEEAARNYAKVRQNCPELRDLEDRIRRWIDATRTRLSQQATKLDAVLRAADLEVVGGTSLFRLVRHRDAHAVHARLAHQQIWTRSFDHAGDVLRFGLPPTEDALRRLAAALTSRSTAR